MQVQNSHDTRRLGTVLCFTSKLLLGAIFLTVDKIEAGMEVVKEAITEAELGDEVVLVLDVGAPEFHTEVQPGQGSAKKGQVILFWFLFSLLMFQCQPLKCRDTGHIIFEV